MNQLQSSRPIHQSSNGYRGACLPVLGTDHLSPYPRPLRRPMPLDFSLNLLLTRVIVTQLVLHGRNTRAVAYPAEINGVYTAISIVLIESRALFTGSSLVDYWLPDTMPQPLSCSPR